MNKIVQENAIVEGRADSSYWDVPHSTEIEGFATDMSVNAGARIDFKINVDSGAGSDYRVEIFRLGYYGGSGAREVVEWTNTNAKVQPNALVDASRGTVDAGNWSVTDSWNVPADAVSGVYLARLQRLDSNGDPIGDAVNQIPFIVRNDGETHDIVLQTSDTTWQAYNAWGGNNGVVGANLYGDMNGSINWDPIDGAGNYSQDRAYAVSYNRPFITRDGTGTVSGPQDYLFGADYAAIQWLEKQGYDVAYISGMDTDRLGADYLKNYKSFISVGHDEYWSGDQRANVEEARDAGVNLLFWSGNEVYWKTRWDVAYSADGTAYRTLVCYKETLAVLDTNADPQDYYNLDPTNTWTGTWMDTRFHGNPMAGGGNPQDVDPITGLNPACHCAQNQLTGQLFGPDGTGQFGGALDVPANYGSLRYWRDTAAADGGELNMAPGIVGYEWDTSPDDSLRPAGLIKLSETTLPWNGILIDQGNTTVPGTATHTLSLYRSASGSLVFGAGTVFWSWALSDMHDSSPYGANIQNLDIQQFTINMFADMGIQPAVADAYLISQGLIRATGSSDIIAAVATINDLPDTVEAYRAVTITGTATDNDGNPLTTDGKVAAVEVSVDGGTNWKLAYSTDGWATWHYSWVPTVQGAGTIKARAIDDSLNVYSITPDSEAVTVTAPTTFSTFSGGTPVSPILNNDATPVELGMRFSVDRSGSVTELKYWRGSGDASDTDVREGHLWRADGTLLATTTFTSNPGQAGWQVATLSSPVTLAAGVQYVVSYQTNDRYVSTNSFFVDANDVAFDGLDNNSFWGIGGVVRAVQDGAGGTNGVYHYGGGTAVMPSQSFEGANYWVDITFDPSIAPANSAPVFTSASVVTSPENRLAAGTITAIDSDGNLLAYSIAGGADAARFTINSSTGALSFISPPDFETPADAGANNVYDLIVGVSDGVAPLATQAITVSVTNLAETGGGSSNVFSSTDAPAATQTTDTTDYELGMRFTASAGGSITELRYFRGAADAGDTDVRVLNLWNAAGLRLGSVTVTSTAGESGWQVGTLSAPITVQAGATYIVSYGTTQNYAFTENYFNTAHTGPGGFLTAGINGGVFADGTPGVFPTASWNASNYWADVTFVPGAAPNSAPVITSATALTSPENRLAAGTIVATDVNGDVLAYAIIGGADAARFTINASTGALSFVSAPDYETPADAGANNIYDLIVGVSDGIAPPVTQAVAVTVTNLAETGGGNSNVFAPTDVPTATETTDTTDYELGMRFTANVAGTITELRYFRGAADANDTDARTMNLWSGNGTLLGSVSVTSTAGQSGWQVGTLSTPITVQAGSTYVVSYGTTQNYAYTTNYFNTAHTGPDGLLTAGANSGVFADGSPGVFPTATWNGSNYWADVTFVPSAAVNTAPVVTSAAAMTSPENQLAIGTIVATDANGNPLTYAIAGGADAARFAINASTGALSFVSAPDYETPADAGANNIYDVTVSVSDGIAPPVTRAITVAVTDVSEAPPNTAPVFTSAATVSATENQLIATTLAATDANGDALTYAIAGGADAARFAIDASTGILSFVSSPDFETPADSGADNIYNLTVSVSDGTAAAVIQAMAITVTDVAEVPGNTAPVFTSPTTASSAENQLVAATLAATDADGNALTYAITGGADATRFTIDASSGVLSFVAPPDFEAPADAGANDVYDVAVSVTDGIAPAVTQALAITVIDVAEVPANSAPVFTSPGTASAAENQLIAAALAATDANGDALAYAITSGADAGRFTIDTSTGVLSFVAPPDFEAPADASADNVYDLTVSVSDGIAPAMTQALAITVTDVADANLAPTISPILAPNTNEDVTSQVQINLLSGAADPEGSSITVLSPVSVTSSNAARTVAFTVSAAGILTFDPAQFGTLNTGQSELLTVSYRISDGVNAGVLNTATITVEGRDEIIPGQILTGTSGNNTLTGGEGNDTISGLAGNDTIRGNGGNDTINGGANTDNIDAGAGNDLILIGASDAVSDTMAGGFGTDTVKITGTADAVLTGTSQMTGIEIFDGSGLSLRGTNSANTFNFGTYTLTNLAAILALGGNDTVIGSTGADVIDGGSGTDSIDGGLGNDTIRVTGTEAQADTMAGGGGTDMLQIYGSVDLTLNGTSTITGIETLDGGGRSISGTTGNNTINLSIFNTVTNLAGVLALAGNDTVIGSAGADVINGGSGTDNIDGGLGNDTIRVTGTEAQTDTMAGGGGIDMLQIFGSVDLTLNGTSTITGIETLDGGGRSIIGTTGANTIDLSIFNTVTTLVGVRGLDGNDTLTGSSFADRLDGGAGTDTIRSGAGDDTIVVRTNEALNDIIDGGAGGADRIVVDGSSSLSLSNTGRITGIERLEGGGGAIVGSSSADTLDFSGIVVSGISSIQGGSGADTIAGGTGADVLSGGLGNDTFVFRIDVPGGADRITDFDVLGNDVIRLVGFSPSSDLNAATTFDSQGALIDLSDIGGTGTIRLTGVTSLNYTTEDFLFV